MKVLVSFWRLPFAEQRTTLWVVMIATVVECMIRRWPLPRVVRALGVTWMRDAGTEQRDAALRLSLRDKRMLRCTRRVMRWWPFCKGSCLRQSLVLGYALRRHGPRLRLGITPQASGFDAHAWLEVCGESIGASEGFHILERPSGPSP